MSTMATLYFARTDFPLELHTEIAHYVGLQGCPSVDIKYDAGHFIVTIDDEDVALATKLKFKPVPKNRYDHAAAEHAARMIAWNAPSKPKTWFQRNEDGLVAAVLTIPVVSIGFTLWSAASALWGLL